MSLDFTFCLTIFINLSAAWSLLVTYKAGDGAGTYRDVLRHLLHTLYVQRAWKYVLQFNRYFLESMYLSGRYSSQFDNVVLSICDLKA